MYLTIDKMFMYLTEQNVHIFDWTKCTCIWLNKMYMYLTEKNLHVFLLNKAYMYLTVSINYMYFDYEQSVHIFDWTKCTCI
jgi:hypothetical protein